MTTRAQIQKVVLAALKKFKDAPARSIAKRLYQDNPHLWSNLDACRSSVRYYLGVLGKRNATSGAHREFHRPPRRSGWSYVIPKELQQLRGWKPIQVTGPHRTAILSDIHIPFHDSRALTIALDHIAQQSPTLILLNGDTFDHYAISRFAKNPRLRNFPLEVTCGRRFLEGLRTTFPNARILFKFGNHEERYELYLQMQCVDLLGIEAFEWESVFHTKEYGIEVIRDKRPVRLGKLNVIHGHEYPFPISNPVNPARGLFLKAGVHSLCGHFHRSSFHPQSNLEKKEIGCWSTGCLCSLTPAYAPINTWGHGFAFVEHTDKTFNVQNLRIIGGKVWRA